MGNLLVTGASIFVPLINNVVVAPYLLHPYNLGGLPWREPHWLFLGAFTFMLNIIVLMLLSMISGTMNTLNGCKKINFKKALKRSLWIVLGYIVGNITVFTMPFIKAPLLTIGIWLPYAGWLIHGFLVAPSIMFFGAMGNTVLRSDVCGRT